MRVKLGAPPLVVMFWKLPEIVTTPRWRKQSGCWGEMATDTLSSSVSWVHAVSAGAVPTGFTATV